MEQSVRQAYDETWEGRRHLPIVTGSWVNNDWAKGRTDYLTFLIRVDDKQVIDAAKAVQERLSDFDCLGCYPKEYLHVTVKETGCFLTEDIPAEDELTEEQVERLIDDAAKALKGVSAFKIHLNRVNHFRSNLVFEAHDGGEVREMNRRLMGLKGIRKLTYDYPRFLPHMSVCLFKCDSGHEEIVDLLEDLRDTEVGTLMVESIDLVKAILPKEGITPKLETLHRFTLS